MKTWESFIAILAFVLSTILMFFTILLSVVLIPQLKPELVEIMILLSFLLEIAGYIGLIMVLKGKVNEKPKRVLFLLLCGILSFLLFTSIVGGKTTWTWVLTLQEPFEWFLILWPTLVSAYFVVKAIRVLNSA
ncbi:hypothetical protein K6119_04235 [Paracrocinitomix mangrovi]|uniref:hypothetical protein n=1 Tax=Paracrocinitomix mangrovi TaxID=2862509 RepID=UPI001C8E3D8C|nr:hypothetical protein [Paracrocinitomix mangrovi]UKN02722.1 hypothetical protein K6119_04235 [Paracrocinitomix mangrovi]